MVLQVLSLPQSLPKRRHVWGERYRRMILGKRVLQKMHDIQRLNPSTLKNKF